ncbi:MAG: hypothetical protein OEU36_16060 [Gammaproteobacteria bacterium]|nr:hypothetical protein [Gammaproteobacteria bacterium]
MGYRSGAGKILAYAAIVENDQGYEHANGIDGVGYSVNDIPTLFKGAYAQHRLLKTHHAMSQRQS